MPGVCERPRPFVVVLTGGPCSGKSSALALLRDRLSSRGFQVLTVPENATHFLTNSDGFQPEWAGTFSQVRMQRLFLDYQIAQEEAFKAFAELHPTKPAVLLLDCCTLNSKVYLSEAQWQQVLKMPGKPALTEEELFARYDLVVHMVSCATEGHYEFGPGSNNPGRYSTREQAQDADRRSLEVFGVHPQLRVVPHFEEFDEKIGKVAEFVKDALHIEGLAGKRCRRACRVVCEEELVARAASAASSASMVVNTFLDDRFHHSVRKHVRIPVAAWLQRFRQWRGCPAAAAAVEEPIQDLQASAECLYERRSQVQPPDMPDKSYLTRKAIRAEEYHAAVASRSVSCPEAALTTKYVLRFMEGASYYELFFFLNEGELVLDAGVEDNECQSLGAWLEPVPGATATAPSLAVVPSVPVSCATANAGSADARHSNAKRRRVRRHSTEEAALFRS